MLETASPEFFDTFARYARESLRRLDEVANDDPKALVRLFKPQPLLRDWEFASFFISDVVIGVFDWRGRIPKETVNRNCEQDGAGNDDWRRKRFLKQALVSVAAYFQLHLSSFPRAKKNEIRDYAVKAVARMTGADAVGVATAVSSHEVKPYSLFLPLSGREAIRVSFELRDRR